MCTIITTWMYSTLTYSYKREPLAELLIKALISNVKIFLFNFILFYFNTYFNLFLSPFSLSLSSPLFWVMCQIEIILTHYILKAHFTVLMAVCAVCYNIVNYSIIAPYNCWRWCDESSRNAEVYTETFRSSCLSRVVIETT